MAAVRVVMVLAGLAAMATAGPKVTTPDGIVEGTQFLEHQRFAGIPFAQPPVGQLRLQPPETVLPWNGTLSAKDFGNDCLDNKGDYIDVHNKSEDCLYLNVFRGHGIDENSKAPVLLFFYGGSYEHGGSSFPIYFGGELVRHAPVILVTSNYRLGPLGYLGSKALQASSKDGSTGNYGLQDQREAMRWIKRSISAFGGDPNNVMIFGESAGAGSVSAHAVAHRSAGLFHRVGMESGPPTDWIAMTMARAEAHFDRVANMTGCNKQASVVQCLRSVPATELLEDEADKSHTLIHWSPVIDSVEFTDHPQQLWRRGKINPFETMLIGTNTNEGTEFIDVPGKDKLTAANYSIWLHQRYGDKLGAKIEQLYPASNFSSPWFAAAMVFTDSLMACPTRRAARWVSHYTEAKSFVYHFTHQLDLLKLAEPQLGVMHASELPLVFKVLFLLLGPGEVELATKFQSYWSGVAAAGDPNHFDQKIPAWPAFRNTTGDYLELDITVQAKQNLKTTECDFWDKIFEAGCQMLLPPCTCNVTL